MFDDLRFRVRALFQRRKVEAELDDELRAHCEHEVEKYARAGVHEEEARRRARLALGGLQQTKEDCRAAAVLALLATGFCAACMPAQRAARVDPMVALRHE